MNTTFDFGATTGPDAEDRIVYVRAVVVADLPLDLQEQAEGRETIYALHDAAGTRLALVAERDMAFNLARQNDMAPVAVY